MVHVQGLLVLVVFVLTIMTRFRSIERRREDGVGIFLIISLKISGKIQERIYDMSEYVAKMKDLLCFSWLKIFIKNTLLLFVTDSFVISFFF